MTERSPDATDADSDVHADPEADADAHPASGPASTRETEPPRDPEPQGSPAADATVADEDSAFPGEAVLGVPGDDDRERPPMEPEPVSAENAAFVLLGVAFTVFVLAGAL
jgi:hypothetical protein